MFWSRYNKAQDQQEACRFLGERPDIFKFRNVQQHHVWKYVKISANTKTLQSSTKQKHGQFPQSLNFFSRDTLQLSKYRLGMGMRPINTKSPSLTAWDQSTALDGRRFSLRLGSLSFFPLSWFPVKPVWPIKSDVEKRGKSRPDRYVGLGRRWGWSCRRNRWCSGKPTSQCERKKMPGLLDDLGWHDQKRRGSSWRIALASILRKTKKTKLKNVWP